MYHNSSAIPFTRGKYYKTYKFSKSKVRTRHLEDTLLSWNYGCLARLP
jgi:hypothetical protein